MIRVPLYCHDTHGNICPHITNRIDLFGNKHYRCGAQDYHTGREELRTAISCPRVGSVGNALAEVYSYAKRNNFLGIDVKNDDEYTEVADRKRIRNVAKVFNDSCTMFASPLSRLKEGRYLLVQLNAYKNYKLDIGQLASKLLSRELYIRLSETPEEHRELTQGG